MPTKRVMRRLTLVSQKQGSRNTDILAVNTMLEDKKCTKRFLCMEMDSVSWQSSV